MTFCFLRPDDQVDINIHLFLSRFETSLSPRFPKKWGDIVLPFAVSPSVRPSVRPKVTSPPRPFNGSSRNFLMC
jgi:hypothetical protein